uniref:Uncharacterized protein n=1 Tax=Oryza nivara TaxID=4536 RepID=A0A0E0IYV8_ORYNI
MEPHEEDEVEDAKEFEEVFTVEDLIAEDDIFEEIVAEGFKADMDREASTVHRRRRQSGPRRNSTIKARPTHRQLKKDLIEHIWQRYGNKEN